MTKGVTSVERSRPVLVLCFLGRWTVKCSLLRNKCRILTPNGALVANQCTEEGTISERQGNVDRFHRVGDMIPTGG